MVVSLVLTGDSSVLFSARVAVPEDGLTPSQREFQEVRPPSKRYRGFKWNEHRMLPKGHPYHTPKRPVLVPIERSDDSGESSWEEPERDSDHDLPSRYERS